MADPRIKQKGTQRGMTTEQLWRERDLIDQINKGSKSVSDRVSQLENLNTFGRIIGMAAVLTDGAGGFTYNFGRGITVSISGTRLRVTFSPERPTVGSEPHYEARYTAIGVGTRTSTMTAYTAAGCNLVVRNAGGGEVSFLGPEEGRITVVDYD
jgi:hypothetical protein